MVCHSERKTDIGLFLENDMRAVVDLVSKVMSLRQAAAAKNVNYGTLFR
jgi:alanine racemase